jgi:hypothetical protein
MKRVLVLCFVVGCGSSPAGVCAGTHVGTFDGSDVGTMSATLDETGKAQVTLVGEASGTLSSDGQVDDEGTILLSGIVSVEGVLDLDTCESSGTWSQSLAGLTGSWSMSPQSGLE